MPERYTAMARAKKPRDRGISGGRWLYGKQTAVTNESFANIKVRCVHCGNMGLILRTNLQGKFKCVKCGKMIKVKSIIYPMWNVNLN